MNIPRRARIIGLGSYLPNHTMTNADMEKIVETTDEWIYTRTGIRSRRIAAEGEYPSTMGLHAAKEALEKAEIGSASLDLIIVATMSGDYPSPSTAALVQDALGAKRAAAMDVSAACSGYVYALATAKAYVESGMARHVLVVAAEKMSSILDFTDRTTCVLFGDGASAAVVSSEGKGLLIGPVKMGADGSLSDLVIIRGGGTRHPASAETLAQGLHYFRMSGKELYKHAVRKAAATAEECLCDAKLPIDKLDWMIPHQANQRMMDAIAKALGMPAEKNYSVVEKYGNTSAAGIGIALTELCKTQQLPRGSHILLNAFGGGFTCAAALLEKEE